jgi:uncharacterized ion transporter superfamily protein YfcC
MIADPDDVFALRRHDLRHGRGEPRLLRARHHVMIARGYDASPAPPSCCSAAASARSASTINPFATGIASGFAGVSLSDGLSVRAGDPGRRPVIGIFFVLRYADRSRPTLTSSVYDMQRDNERTSARRTSGARSC